MTDIIIDWMLFNVLSIGSIGVVLLFIGTMSVLIMFAGDYENHELFILKARSMFLFVGSMTAIVGVSVVALSTAICWQLILVNV